MPTTETRIQQDRSGLVTIVFTDMVDSTRLKTQFGDRASAALFDRHHDVVRECLNQFPGSEEIDTAGDSFLVTFATPSDAVEFALMVQCRLEDVCDPNGTAVQDRIGIHAGEVVIRDQVGKSKPRDLFGVQVDTCARVMSMAQGGQILMTRVVFDNARQVLKGGRIGELNTLYWASHGSYLLKGLDDPIDICEVGEEGRTTATAPEDTEKTRRMVAPDEEGVLGWRPAIGQKVPNSKWALLSQLGEGGFGEVWLAQHETLKEKRVFKFCFRADRVRSLKREVTLFRVLKEKVGGHPNIVAVHDVFLDEPPFYLMMDYVEGKDLRSWCEAEGGVENVPLETRLDIVAKVADALEAAHDAGVIHRDVKPANILVGRRKTPVGGSELVVKLTDFGIGQVATAEALAGMTKLGFTMTIASEGSSSGSGTQMYMAPELLVNSPASTRSDIYSLGIVLYQLLVGDFSRPLTTDWVKDIENPLLREDLQNCFAGQPQERFAGAGQLESNLRSLTEREEALTREQAELEAAQRQAYRKGMYRMAGIAAVVVVAIAFLAVMALRNAKVANEQTELAREQTQVATQQSELARQNLYAADMLLANLALKEDNLGRVAPLLTNHIPTASQEDLRGWEWRYLWEQSQGDELFTLTGHSNFVAGVAYLDSKRVVSGSFDGTIRVWDLTAQRAIKVIDVESSVFALQASPEGNAFATGSGDGRLRVWDATDYKLLAEFSVRTGLAWERMCFSKDGERLAVIDRLQDGSQVARIWDWRQNTEIPLDSRLADAAKNAPRTVMFSPTTNVLAVALKRRVELWDLDRGTTERLRTPADDDPLAGSKDSLSYSPDGRLLAGGGKDNIVSVWDAQTGKVLHSHSNHTAAIRTVAFSPNDGRYLASASTDHMIRIWDVARWEEVASYRGHWNEVWSLAFSPDGNRLLTGGKDDLIKVWDTTPRIEPDEFQALLNQHHRFVFSQHSEAMALVDGNGRLSVRDWPSLKELRALNLPGPEIMLLALGKGDSVVAVARKNGDLELWTIDGPGNMSWRQAGVVPNFEVVLELSGDGESVSLLTMTGTAEGESDYRRWSVDDGTLQQTINLDRPVAMGAVSGDARRFAVGNNQGELFIWNTSSDTHSRISAHKNTISEIEFSTDGKILATASWDGFAKLWDTATSQEIARLRSHLLGVDGLAFSRDGTRLLTGTGRGTFTVWDVVRRRELVTLSSSVHSEGTINSILFPYRDIIVSGHSNGSDLWGLQTVWEVWRSLPPEAIEIGRN